MNSTGDITPEQFQTNYTLRQLLTTPANFRQMTPEEQVADSDKRADQVQKILLDEVNRKFGFPPESTPER